MSGIYFYGSGQRTQAVCGCDARGLQITSIDRLRLDGTIIPREAFVGGPIHRVELRLQQRVRLGGPRGDQRLHGSVQPVQPRELRLASYDVTETSPTYGQPVSSPNLSYAPRTVQLGFRFTF